MEWERKCISDGANVNYQNKVSYDVNGYHIEGSIVFDAYMYAEPKITSRQLSISVQVYYMASQIHVYSVMSSQIVTMP